MSKYYYQPDGRDQLKLDLIFANSKWGSLSDYMKDCIEEHYTFIQRHPNQILVGVEEAKLV